MATGRNGNIMKWITIIITLALVVLGWAYTLGIQRERLETNCGEDAKVHPQVPIIDTRVTRVEENVKAIDRNMAEQKTMQQQILNKQDQILWELQRQ